MSVLYADASAIARVYFADEPDQSALAELLLDGEGMVLTSEITRLEFASVVRAAARARRVPYAEPFLEQFDLHCGREGPILLLELEPSRIFPVAHTLLREHRLRTLDAIHLATALEEAPRYSPDERVVLVTRDDDQADAARALGLEVA